MNVSSASILICTYNRARLLRETLAALQAMTPPAGCQVEIIIVDNNSSDNTQLVIAEAIDRATIPVIAIRESAQGKSFALNSGLRIARGDIVALTDDDVWPDPEWLARIVDDFRQHDVTFVFGKVLPRWSRLPPPELLSESAQDIWGPLAIVDYGDTPVDYLSERSGRLPIGANLSFVRAALLTIGGWRTDLGKVNNTLISGEDHEIFMRLQRHDLFKGYYDPAVAVHHFVPAGRLTRRYFRRWFFWHGRTQALMIDDLHLELDMSRVPRVAGVPRFLYRQSLYQLWRWIRTWGSRDPLDVFREELLTLQRAGLLFEFWRRRKSGMSPGSAHLADTGTAATPARPAVAPLAD